MCKYSTTTINAQATWATIGNLQSSKCFGCTCDRVCLWTFECCHQTKYTAIAWNSNLPLCLGKRTSAAKRTRDHPNLPAGCRTCLTVTTGEVLPSCRSVALTVESIAKQISALFPSANIPVGLCHPSCRSGSCFCLPRYFNWVTFSGYCATTVNVCRRLFHPHTSFWLFLNCAARR